MFWTGTSVEWIKGALFCSTSSNCMITELALEKATVFVLPQYFYKCFIRSFFLSHVRSLSCASFQINTCWSQLKVSLGTLSPKIWRADSLTSASVKLAGSFAHRRAVPGLVEARGRMCCLSSVSSAVFPRQGVTIREKFLPVNADPIAI